MRSAGAWALLAGAANVTGFGAQAWAQSREEATEQPSIVAPSKIDAEAGSEVALPITIRSPRVLLPGTFLRVRGVPKFASLSQGHSIWAGTWIVEPASLPGLALFLPPELEDASEITVTLVAPDGSTLADARVAITIAARHAGNGGEPAHGAALAITSMTPAPLAVAPPPAAIPPLPDVRGEPAAPPSPLPAPDLSRARRLLEKGHGELRDGNVADARLYYRRAADGGLAAAALALARTYDAAVLASLGIQGVPADAREVARWTERARELGDAERGRSR